MDSAYYRLWIALVYGVLLVTALYKEKRSPMLPLTLCGAALTLSVCMTVATFREGALTAAVLDVGQGQSVLLRSGDHLTLVDCGGDGAQDPGDVAANYLQGLGSARLDLLVISHFHADHAGGVPQLLRRVEVDAIAIPGEEEGDLAQEILSLARELGTEIHTIQGDTRLSTGSGAVTLYPPMGGGELNESGLSVLASGGSFDILITGDMGADMEELLLAHSGLGQVDALVVGHHGSDSSTGETFLQTIHPQVALISAGVDNRYGHPAPSTLERLRGVGAEIYRTDLNGTILLRGGMEADTDRHGGTLWRPRQSRTPPAIRN